MLLIVMNVAVIYKKNNAFKRTNKLYSFIILYIDVQLRISHNAPEISGRDKWFTRQAKNYHQEKSNSFYWGDTKDDYFFFLLCHKALSSVKALSPHNASFPICRQFSHLLCLAGPVFRNSERIHLEVFEIRSILYKLCLLPL